MIPVSLIRWQLTGHSDEVPGDEIAGLTQTH